MSKERWVEIEDTVNLIDDNIEIRNCCAKLICKLLNDKEKQLAELKAENERLKKYETVYYLNQLQASNENINKFKQNELQQCINIYDLLKYNTKQVCEKIRKLSIQANNDQFYIKITEILDQIEKGE